MIRFHFVLKPPWLRVWLAAALAPLLTSCAFLIDFDELAGGSSPDSGIAAGDGGSSGGASGAGANGGIAGADGGSDASVGGSNVDASMGGSAGMADADLGISLGDLPTFLAGAACNALEKCAGSAIELILGAEDCETFFVNTLADGYAAAIDASLQAGRLTYDPVAAAACADSLIDAAEQDPPQCSAFNSIIERCKSALGGLSSEGEPCRHPFECAESLLCDVSSTCPGLCVAMGTEGAPCTVNEDCDPTLNLYCRTEPGPDGGMSGACTAYVPLDQPCMVTTDTCEVGALCISQVCRPIADLFTAAEGFGCYTTGTLCQPGLSCEFSGLPFNPLAAATCVSEKAPLDACKIALPDECPSGHYCSANGLNTNGQCLALPSLNQPCATGFLASSGLVPQCATGHACVEGICKAKARIGGTCEANTQCYSGLCSGACAAPSCQ